LYEVAAQPATSSSRRRQVKRAQRGDVVFFVFCVSPFGSVPAIFLFATNKRTNQHHSKKKVTYHTVNLRK
jgi:hypothetical protein